MYQISYFVFRIALVRFFQEKCQSGGGHFHKHVYKNLRAVR